MSLMEDVAVLWQQLLDNPVNWVLLLLVLWMVRQTVLAGTPQIVEAKHAKVIKLRDYTLAELSKFNGATPETPVYMGIKGKVYDVTAGRSYYGPGGAYGSFGGRDASRGLAKHSYDESVVLERPDDLSDLNAGEMEELNNWIQFFETKYTVVGYLK